MINGKMLVPGKSPQAPPDDIDQPNTNPPAQPLIPITSFTSYTSLPKIEDGTSNTLMIGEKHVRKVEWGKSAGGDQAYYSGASYDTAQRQAGPSYPLASSEL